MLLSNSTHNKRQLETQSYLLETFNFNTDHSGQNIASELTRVVSEWCSPNILCCTTDNASNMTSGIQKTRWKHLPCFAHTLNLVVQEAVNSEQVLSKLQEKCKHIAAHFHRSTKSSKKLRSVQQQLNLPQLKLIQDVVMRWYSGTYLMFEWVITQHEAITTTLCLQIKEKCAFLWKRRTLVNLSLYLLYFFKPLKR